jgi:hypothetical protein
MSWAVVIVRYIEWLFYRWRSLGNLISIAWSNSWIFFLTVLYNIRKRPHLFYHLFLYRLPVCVFISASGGRTLLVGVIEGWPGNETPKLARLSSMGGAIGITHRKYLNSCCIFLHSTRYTVSCLSTIILSGWCELPPVCAGGGDWSD